MGELSDRLIAELVDAVRAQLRREQTDRLRDVYLIGDIEKDTARSCIERLRELHADTLVITGEFEAASNCSRAVIMPKEIGEFVAPIPYIIPGQLFAALLAEAKGLDADQPRSLSKVTRTL